MSIKNIIRNIFQRNKGLSDMYALLSRFKVWALRGIPDQLYIKVKYRVSTGQNLNLSNPKTFNEKLQWIKLFDRNPFYTILSDKYLVREYVAEKVGSQYLNELYGAYDCFDEIDFEALPDKFVLKCNHDCGSIVLCSEKKKLNLKKTKKKLDSALKRNYYYVGREWPYKNIKPKIIIEKFLVDESGYELKDYKFYCFNGEPKVLFIISDRGKGTKCDYFDMEFNRLPFTQGYPASDRVWTKPKNFEEMKVIAGKLSEGIPQVRVDLYDICGKIYFGEMTFFDAGGMAIFEPQEWNSILGQYIDLNIIKN